MENKKVKEYYTIDIWQIVRAWLHRAWVIILSGILTAVLGFSFAAFFITPTYSSSIMLYVNNNSISVGGANFSISASEITAAQNLVSTYSVILNNRTTLERVIDKTGVPYTYQELSGMIEAGSANETEILRITVTTEDPYEAAKIANGIAEVLPVRIAEIIDGATMEVVDSAVPNLSKVAPSITTYTMVGLLLGLLVSMFVLGVIATLDDTIHSEEYILQNYEVPILAKVPDLLGTGGKRYGYRYGYHYGYQYGYYESHDEQIKQRENAKK